MSARHSLPSAVRPCKRKLKRMASCSQIELRRGPNPTRVFVDRFRASCRTHRSGMPKARPLWIDHAIANYLSVLQIGPARAGPGGTSGRLVRELQPNPEARAAHAAATG